MRKSRKRASRKRASRRRSRRVSRKKTLKYSAGGPPGVTIGTLYLADGNVYVGDLRDGVMHGQGTMTWPNGDKYIGEWGHNMRNGLGTMTWPMTWPFNSKKYVGEWRDDLLHGYGIIYLTAAVGQPVSSNVWDVMVDGKGIQGLSVSFAGELLNDRELLNIPVSIKNIEDALENVGTPYNIIDFILNEYAHEHASNISSASTTHSSHGATKRLEKREIRQRDAAIKSHYEDILGHPWDEKTQGPLPPVTGLSPQGIRDRTRVWKEFMRGSMGLTELEKALIP